MNTDLDLILSTAYFPPVQYFARIMRAGKVKIEVHESYHKQTYRNRCIIYSANGPLSLTVPVEQGSFHKIPISELRIDNSRKWQQTHLRAINTAYRSAAFFEFYFDELERFFTQGFENILDLNKELLNSLLELLGIERSIGQTEYFMKEYPGADDFRYTIKPKNQEDFPDFNTPEYFQVFSPKYGFLKDLSILDLIFNMGPEAYNYLESC